MVKGTHLYFQSSNLRVVQFKYPEDLRIFITKTPIINIILIKGNDKIMEYM